MTRNRELAAEAAVGTLLVAAACTCGFLLAGVRCAAVVTVLGCALLASHLAFAARRYRAIAALARRVDQALATGRDVSFDDMREGELSILASEVDKAISRLAVANEDLTAEKAALADALADISHQIRTPLTSLGLELELLRRESVTDSQRRHALDSERLLERVQWLVSALLKLARLDAGAVELVRQEVSVARLVECSAEPLAVSFDLHDVTLDLSGVDPTATFMGDAAWTREALSNILKNCLEHTPAGGTVSVDASEDALATRIRVRDSGRGISQEDLPHVFERFYHGRTSGEDRVNPAGVGIGLSLAQALVSAQGGTIKAGNVTGPDGEVLGARFDVVFFKVTV